jgi:hypothetical protein
MKIKTIGYTSALLLLSSCASLQQAPLIYSSKSTVGIDLSSSTTESPGASISIGVKLVDAAYVPVAVSKRIGSQEGVDLNDQILKIEAVFGEGITQGTIDNLTEENKRKIIDYLNAKLAEESIASRISSIKQEISSRRSNEINLSRQIEELKSQELSDLREDSDESKNRIPSLETQILESEKERQELEKKIPVIEAELRTAEQQSQKLLEEAAKAASFLRTDKRDAMSVYGRFSSRSTAAIDRLNSALTAGKIFSTGVASQNLTEAARYEAIYDGFTACLASMVEIYKIAVAEKKNEVLGLIQVICNPSALKSLEPKEKS